MSEDLKEIQKTIASNLIRFRVRKNLSVDSVCKKAGIAPNYWVLVETRRTVPSLPTLLKMSKGLDVKLVELLK